jgi:3,4-dihydroxy-9,10-secoandrosta-1,3,5(10)-triene-9,17-dione 4,5-dioxygenase
MEIKSLGYVGFGAPDPKQWLAYGTEIIGLMPARACPGESWGMPATAGGEGPASRGSGIAADGSVYLKMDDRQWRIGIHPSQDNAGLLYMGFEVAGVLELQQAVAEIQSHGFDVESGSEEEARARAVTGLASFTDPNGFAVEIFYGQTADRKFKSPTDTRFKTGGFGVGHMNLFVPDMQKSLDFYIRVLGFKLTDYIGFAPGMSAQFLHCNPRHHTIALTRIGDVTGIHHLMLEVETVDDVGRALERVEAAGIPVTSTLGRHTNDRMLSFYMASPFGFEVEIGTGAIEVGDDWSATEFCEGDIWGHKGLDPESIQASGEKINA